MISLCSPSFQTSVLLLFEPQSVDDRYPCECSMHANSFCHPAWYSLEDLDRLGTKTHIRSVTGATVTCFLWGNTHCCCCCCRFSRKISSCSPNYELKIKWIISVRLYLQSDLSVYFTCNVHKLSLLTTWHKPYVCLILTKCKYDKWCVLNRGIY